MPDALQPTKSEGIAKTRKDQTQRRKTRSLKNGSEESRNVSAEGAEITQPRAKRSDALGHNPAQRAHDGDSAESSQSPFFSPKASSQIATHFTILAPVNEIIARKILKDTANTNNISFTKDELTNAFSKN
ncbi:MAG: hypothetical protein JWM04_542 [Verrucomicrobiales bacterium]|nr:hypothetical protein [Verrucomicrobiales bacterium]